MLHFGLTSLGKYRALNSPALVGVFDAVRILIRNLIGLHASVCCSMVVLPRAETPAEDPKFPDSCLGRPYCHGSTLAFGLD
jgi:hypothetical protein